MSKVRWWNPFTWFNAIVNEDGEWTILGGGSKTNSGEVVNAQTAMKLPVVYSCIRVLADVAASIPLKTYDEKTGNRMVAQGTDHMLRRMKRPNRYVSMRSFIRFLIVNLCESGNAFAMIARNRNGEPTQIIPVYWQLVQIIIDENGEGITYQVTLPDGSLTLVSYENMIHCKIFSRDGLVGIDPITNMAESLGLGMAAQRWAASFMKTGGWTGGYIVYKEFLTPEQQAQVRATLPDMRAGNSKDIGKMGLLQGGPDVKPMATSPKDGQFIEGRQFQDDEIAGAFGVQPWLINRMKSSSYVGTGLEQQLIVFLIVGLNPHLQEIEDELNSKLLTDKDGKEVYFCEFTRQALMQMDSKARAEYYKTGLGGSGGSGWLSVNEVRRKENEPVIEGDEYDRVTVWQFGNDSSEDKSNGN